MIEELQLCNWDWSNSKRSNIKPGAITSNNELGVASLLHGQMQLTVELKSTSKTCCWIICIYHLFPSINTVTEGKTSKYYSSSICLFPTLFLSYFVFVWLEFCRSLFLLLHFLFSFLPPFLQLIFTLNAFWPSIWILLHFSVYGLL